MPQPKLLKPGIYITIFVILSQIIGFVTQMVSASYFGSSFNMDAFLAANTAPYYLVIVFSGALSPILIPFFFDAKYRYGDNAAWEIMSSLLTYLSVIFILFVIIGIIFSENILSFITPGLAIKTLTLAVKLSPFFWLILFLTIYNIIISSFYQINNKFIWQAFVPVIGSVIYLLCLVFFLPFLGIFGLVFSLLINNIIQSILLSSLLLKDKRICFSFRINISEFRHFWILFYPFLISGFFIRITPLLERYLASNLAQGSISHLSYSFKIYSLLAMIVSSAISTVIFPKLSSEYANNDLLKFRTTISSNMRLMYFFIAPIIGIGLFLSSPIIKLALERGMFNHADTREVSFLLKIYLFSIIPAALGGITGKALYSFKITKIISIIGTLEAIVYVVYTFILTKYFGLIGVPIGYFIYFTISIIWALLIIRYKIGAQGGRAISIEFLKITISAIVASGLTYLSLKNIEFDVLKIVSGIFVGFTTFIICTSLLKSSEFKKIRNLIGITLFRKSFNNFSNR